MSISLVKKSLQLLDTSKSVDTDKLPKKPQKTVVKKKRTEKKKLRRGAADFRSSMIERVEKIQKQVREKHDFTEENLHLLKALSSQAVDEKEASKIFKLANRTEEEEVEIVKTEEKTAFTEEDFKMFEREYVFD